MNRRTKLISLAGDILLKASSLDEECKTEVYNIGIEINVRPATVIKKMVEYIIQREKDICETNSILSKNYKLARKIADDFLINLKKNEFTDEKLESYQEITELQNLLNIIFDEIEYNNIEVNTGKVISACRKIEEITIEELAQKSKISINTINLLIKSEKKPTKIQLAQLSKAMPLLKESINELESYFARILKNIRNNANFTQQKIADKLNIPKRTVQSWEGAIRIPSELVQNQVVNILED